MGFFKRKHTYLAMRQGYGVAELIDNKYCNHRYYKDIEPAMKSTSKDAGKNI